MRIEPPPSFAWAAATRPAAEGTVRQRRTGGLGAGLLEEGDDDRVQLAIDALDPGDRCLHELGGAHLPPPHEIRLCRRVEERQLIAHARRLRRYGRRSPV